MVWIGDFRLSITRALADQLDDHLAQLTPEPLSRTRIRGVDERGGVYQLYHKDRLVYIGKADRSLRDRLTQHHRKLGGRANISLDDVRFVALYIDEDLSAVAPETLLIKRHRANDGAAWNFNGFGNNDPGKERDTSKLRGDHFDVLYPADLELASSLPTGTYSLSDLLAQIKAELPYVFRYKDGNRKTQPPEYKDKHLAIERTDMAFSELFETIALVLPDWQITALPGYVIMYPEHRDYKSARRVFGRK